MNLFQFGRRRLPMIQQDSNGECGLACLAMIGQWHGHRMDLNNLRTSYPTTRRGLSLANLAMVADQLRFDVRGYKVDDLDDLKRVRLPAILHWEGNHFVVLKSVRRNRFVIHNPAAGVRVLSREDVEASYSGFVLELQPSESFRIIVKEKRYPLARILELTHGLKASLIQLVCVAVIASLVSMTLPLFVEAALDSVLPQSDIDLLGALAIGLLLVSLTTAAAGWLKARILANAGGAFFAQLTRNAVGQLFRLPLRYFESRHPGDLVTRLESIDFVRTIVTTSFVTAAVDLIMILLSGAIMFFYAPSLALIVSSIFFVVIAIRLLLYPKMRQQGAISLKAKSEERSKMIDSLRAIAALKTSNATVPAAARWYDSFVRFVNASFRMQLTEANSVALVEIMTGVGTAATLYLGVSAVLAGQMTVGMLYAFFTYRTMFFDRIDNLVTTMTHISMLGANMTRLSDFLEIDPEPVSHMVERQLRSGVALRQVTYRAGFADTPILNAVDMEVKAATGQTLMILGPSGSGKTTLLKVMAGLYQPTEGEFEVDGTPLGAWGLAAYRQNIGLLLGADKLLHGSIIENVTAFSLEPDLAKIQAALRLACLDETVADLPRGIETVVSEENGVLSSGQRRRLMLARALYADPPLLLLDEVTANLDEATATAMLANLAAHPATKVITSHDLHVARISHRVFRMEAGALTEIDRSTIWPDTAEPQEALHAQ
ncbi:peptidase domain-containing ABC transporter [Sphingomonas yabuuchiae]|uniref:peptidase domain-containing ABC transporter n=1 Tax=Sphingomonas yabuuchiae TaxID=172044 RepID=UPI0025CE371A|nr:peptidase domain-containing ABC transporter [uncultured Sphingomonas sp.]